MNRRPFCDEPLGIELLPCPSCGGLGEWPLGLTDDCGHCPDGWGMCKDCAGSGYAQDQLAAVADAEARAQEIKDCRAWDCEPPW